MADVIFEWIGNAAPVAQIDDITVPTPAAETYTITINSKPISYVATGTPTAQDIVDGLVAAWQGSSFPETNDATASASATPSVTLTGPADGTPFTVTVSANLTLANTQAPTGPNWWGVAENYRRLDGSTGVPAASDEVVIRANRPAILHGLQSLNAVTLKAITVDMAMTNAIGLADRNPGGYVEYRKQFLEQPATTWNLGRAEGQGSSRIKIDLYALGSTVNILNSASSGEVDKRAIQIVNGDANTATLNMRGGQVDLNRPSASKGGFANINLSGNAECRVWPDFNKSPVLPSNIAVADSAILTIGAESSVVGSGGTINLADSAQLNLLELVGPCVCNARLSGSISSFKLDHPNAVMDFTNHPHLISVMGWDVRRGTIRDPNGVVGWSTGSPLPKGVMVFSEN